MKRPDKRAGAGAKGRKTQLHLFIASETTRHRRGKVCRAAGRIRLKSTLIPVVILVVAFAARAQAPFGVSTAKLGTAQLATVTYNQNSDSSEPSGINYVTWSCSNGCTVWDFPIMSIRTRRVAVFSFGDWRIAAECDIVTANPNPYDLSNIFRRPCDAPGLATKACIELRKGGKDLSVLFESCRKKKGIVVCKDPKNVEKDIRRFAGAASLYHIISVHNVKTAETWPKTLNDLMQK